MQLRFLPSILFFLISSITATAKFEPWITDLNRCSAIIEDPALKEAARLGSKYCPIPPVKVAPMQTLNVVQIQSQLQHLDASSDRPIQKFKTLAEIEAEFSKKKNRLIEGVNFQSSFLDKLESATNAVDQEFKNNPISDPSQHERITQELSDLMIDVNSFCEKKLANGDSGKINANMRRVFSRPEYIYLLANSSFSNQVLNLPMGVEKTGKRYKRNPYQVCLNGEPPFRGHMRFRSKYLFNKEVITNAATQIKKDIDNNRDKIKNERQALKSCNMAVKRSVPMEKIDDCMDQIELLLANDLTSYPNAYLSILKDKKNSPALVCIGLMRAESEKIAKENLSNLYMAAGLISIPLSIAIPGSGIALAMIGGALTFGETAVGVTQILANNRKMEELDAALRSKMVNKDQVEKSKSELQEENSDQMIGFVAGVAGAAGDVVGLLKKGNQARKIANSSEEVVDEVSAANKEAKIAYSRTTDAPSTLADINSSADYVDATLHLSGERFDAQLVQPGNGSPLQKFAKRMMEKHNVAVAYVGSLLKSHGADGMFIRKGAKIVSHGKELPQKKVLMLSRSSKLSGKPTSTEVHEVVHSKVQVMKEAGEDGLFMGDMSSKRCILGMSNDSCYSGWLQSDEIRAHLKQLQKDTFVDGNKKILNETFKNADRVPVDDLINSTKFKSLRGEIDSVLKATKKGNLMTKGYLANIKFSQQDLRQLGKGLEKEKIELRFPSDNDVLYLSVKNKFRNNDQIESYAIVEKEVNDAARKLEELITRKDFEDYVRDNRASAGPDMIDELEAMAEEAKSIAPEISALTLGKEINRLSQYVAEHALESARRTVVGESQAISFIEEKLQLLGKSYDEMVSKRLVTRKQYLEFRDLVNSVLVPFKLN